jgi:hypothetical protein
MGEDYIFSPLYKKFDRQICQNCLTHWIISYICHLLRQEDASHLPAVK